ncbi:hypothetical protein B0H16DRAFT_1825999, partial [Mycena metata]
MSLHKDGGSDNTRASGLSLLHRQKYSDAFVIGAVGLLLLFHGLGQDSGRRTPIQTIGTIQWSRASDCSPGTECGSVIVPKDYFDPTAGMASIAITRFGATKHPKKGTVFLNPGGPGASGTRLATQTFANFIGEDWDLVGWDPRGINRTSPQVRCFESQRDLNLFVASTVLEQGFTVASTSNLSNPAIEAQLVEELREYLVLQKTQAELCAKNMGTEPRNYWGASYGSTLGAYLVTALTEWSTVPQRKWAHTKLASTEETYRFYLKICSRAGPEACHLAQYTDEPYEQIEARLESFFDQLALSPLPVPSGIRPGFLTSGAARALLLTFLLHPPQWADSALAFSQAMKGNATLLFNKLATPRKQSTPHYDLARLAVMCMDALPPPTSPADMPTPEDFAAEFIKNMREVSPHFASSVPIGKTPDAGGCQYWPQRRPERFTGPWNATLEWPMLIVSNTMDP